MNLKKIALLTATATLTTSIAIAAPNISASSDPYFNGGSGIKQKDIIVKPVNIQLDAAAWVAMDYRTGDIVSEKNMDVRRAPASLTKMMTSYIIGTEIKANLCPSVYPLRSVDFIILCVILKLESALRPLVALNE